MINLSVQGVVAVRPELLRQDRVRLQGGLKHDCDAFAEKRKKRGHA